MTRTSLPRWTRTRLRSSLPSQQLKMRDEFREGTKKQWGYIHDWERSSISIAAAASQSSPPQAFMEKKDSFKRRFWKRKIRMLSWCLLGWAAAEGTAQLSIGAVVVVLTTPAFQTSINWSSIGILHHNNCIYHQSASCHRYIASIEWIESPRCFAKGNWKNPTGKKKKKERAFPLQDYEPKEQQNARDS